MVAQSFKDRLKRTPKPTGFGSKLYPDGTFTCGKIPPKRQSQKEKEFNQLHELQYVTYKEKLFYRETPIEKTVWKPADLFWDDADRIGLSSVPNCHKGKDESCKPPARRGLKGITPHQKRIIRNGAYLMQKRYGVRRLGLLTLTLPSVGKDSLLKLLGRGRGWSDLVRKIMQELRREFKRVGAPMELVGCTEIQEKRFRARAEIAPHLHLLYVCRDNASRFYLSADKFRELWARVCNNALQRIGAGEAAYGASVDCQTIKKDACAYLAKYLSKGGEILTEIKEAFGEEFIPNCWGHCSAGLRKMILSSVVSLHPGDVAAIFAGIDLVGRAYLYYLVPIEVLVGDEKRKMGYVGKYVENPFEFHISIYDFFVCK